MIFRSPDGKITLLSVLIMGRAEWGELMQIVVKIRFCGENYRTVLTILEAVRLPL